MRRACYLAIIAGGVWCAIAFVSFRTSVAERNKLVPAGVEQALAATSGPAISSPRNILLIGTDTRGKADDPGRADSMVLLRMDVPGRRYAMLSIPRDLYVDIEGYGEEKINSAYYNGGPALAVKTVAQLTGADVHHYMLIDFNGFKQLIDTLGGIEIDNPREIHSNRFDGKVWRFHKGKIWLGGRRALAYARVRKNILDPNESDLSRGQRQQQVLDAIADEVISRESILHPKEVPHAVVQPLTTDITAGEMVAFAFGRTWAKRDNVLRCRLGGDIDYVDGKSVISGNEENRAVVQMWMGDQPPLRPNLTANQYAGGCSRATATTVSR